MTADEYNLSTPFHYGMNIIQNIQGKVTSNAFAQTKISCQCNTSGNHDHAWGNGMNRNKSRGGVLSPIPWLAVRINFPNWSKMDF